MMPYCENCGKEISPTAKFCRSCGAQQQPLPQQTPISELIELQPAASAPQIPVAAPAAPFQPTQPYVNPQSQAPPQQGPSETVLGVIVLRKPKSLGRYDAFTGIVTNQRMIFAQMTNQMITDAAAQARAEAKAEGKGFFGQWGDQLKATFLYSRKYLTMDPNAVSAETPGNFAINNNCISEISLKLKDISRGQQNVDQVEFQIEVSSSQGKYEFRMDERDEYPNLLKQVYGERVKTPFGYKSFHGVKVKLF